MAIYTLGTGIDQFKGSRGGVTFQKGGSSFSIRTRKKPIFHRTQRTAESRSRFHHVQSNFRELSSGNQATWTTEAPNFPRVNSLGETYTIPGINLFAASNIPLVSAGLTLAPSALAPVTFPSISYSLIGFSINPFVGDISISPDPIPSGFDLEIWTSPIMSNLPERYLNIGLEPIPFDFKSLFRPNLVIPPSPPDDYDLLPGYLASYGPVPTFDPAIVEVIWLVVAGVWLHHSSGQRLLDLVDTADAFP